jgi:hypothetical protein
MGFVGLLALFVGALWAAHGWGTMGRKEPRRSNLKREWTQKELDELEFLKRINDKEKR